MILRELMGAGRLGDGRRWLAWLATSVAALTPLEPLSSQLATPFDGAVEIPESSLGPLASRRLFLLFFKTGESLPRSSCFSPSSPPAVSPHPSDRVK